MPSRLLCPQNSPGKNTGLPFPSPGDLPDQGSNPCLLCPCIVRQVLNHYRHLGSLVKLCCMINPSNQATAVRELRISRCTVWIQKRQRNKGSKCQHRKSKVGCQKKQRDSKETSTSPSLTTLKPLTVWITTNWNILNELGIPVTLPAS